jgi:UDP-N-acetylglucosamine:LPS N-acetylglucosamine transferase
MIPRSTACYKSHEVHRPHVLALSSGGGHWIQLMRLRPALVHCNVDFACVLKSYSADVSEHRFFRIPDANRWERARLAWMFARTAYLILRLRPDVVLSTGAAPGYVAIRAGKAIGARTVWVDSIANVEKLSLSGRLAGKHADLWLTQWEHLANPSGGPRFAGSVL